MHLVDSLTSSFTHQELDRLAAYRAAVTAGFYTDWDSTAEAPDTESLRGWAPPPIDTGATPGEQAR